MLLRLAVTGRTQMLQCSELMLDVIATSDIYLGLGLSLGSWISWNMTTRCSAVTGSGTVGECGRLSLPG